MKECSKYIDLMHKQLDDELSEIEEKMLHKHLAICPACADDYAAFREMAQIFDQTVIVDPPVELKELVMEEIMGMEWEAAVEKSPAIPQKKKGVGILVMVALLNAILFVSRLIPYTWVFRSSVNKVVNIHIFGQMFGRYSLVGRHIAKALKLVYMSISDLIPWSFLIPFGGITIFLALSLFGLLKYEGKID